jgi:hypothetical protein
MCDDLTKKNDMMYATALQCVKLNDEGCARDCAECQYNVFNYVEDTREAALLKATAHTDYYNRQKIYIEANMAKAASSIGPGLVPFLIIGAVLLAVRMIFGG